MAGHRTRRRFGAGNGNTRENSAKLKYKLLVAPAVVIGFLIVYGLVSLQAVRSGIALAQSAGESTREITERMEAMVREVSSISAALEEQGAAGNEIATSVEKIVRMAEETSAAAGTSAASAKALQALADTMHSQVGRFRV